VRVNFEGGVYTREVALDPGKPFPSIALRDEEGQPARVPGGETLYAFFKTTCPTCELAWPYLDRIGKIGEGGSLTLLAISQDDPEATRRFYEDLGVAVPTLYDREPWTASEAVGLTAVPAFFVVGRDGNLRDAVIGFQRHKMEEFAALAADRAGGKRTALFLPGERVPAIKPG
jgi:peroxiredoxin